MQPTRYLPPIAIGIALLGILLSAPPPQQTRALPHANGPTPVSYAHLAYVVNAAQTVTVPDWYAQINSYRTLAGLPPLAENREWSYGNWQHARYIVKNDVVEHSEDAANSWYSAEGHAAAQASNLVGSARLTETDQWAIETWLQAPFHGVSMLDPALRQTAYGSYREEDGGIQMAAALDVLRGLGNVPASVRYPLHWPANGQTIALTQHWGETPSPLTSCPGYTAPSGLPIILQLGPGHLRPSITAHSFLQGTTPLDHCIFDETSYYNPDSHQQSLGRSVLDARDAIVLIPRNPLTAGARYTVVIVANEQVHTWSFDVADNPRAPAGATTRFAPIYPGAR